jgi:molecular chaperone GrpE
MCEIDNTTDSTPDATSPEPAPAHDVMPPPLEIELGLEVIEGLAEEDGASPASATHSGSILQEERSIEAPGDATLVLDAVKGLAAHLGRRLDALQTTLERELRAEATRERVIDRLHGELQEYKQDLLLKVQRPIFVDLIQLHDDIGKMIDARASTDAERDRALAVGPILQSIQTAIEDILYRQGVEPFSLAGDEFDARKQRAVSTVPADDPSLNKTVAARLRKGFESGERVIRPEIVAVYTWRERPPAAVR